MSFRPRAKTGHKSSVGDVFFPSSPASLFTPEMNELLERRGVLGEGRGGQGVRHWTERDLRRAEDSCGGDYCGDVSGGDSDK